MNLEISAKKKTVENKKLITPDSIITYRLAYDDYESNGIMYYYLESNTFLESIEYNTEYEITDINNKNINIRFNLDTDMAHNITIFDGSSRLGGAVFLGVLNSSTAPSSYKMEPEKLVVVLYIRDALTHQKVLRGFSSLTSYHGNYLYRIAKGKE